MAIDDLFSGIDLETLLKECENLYQLYGYNDSKIKNKNKNRNMTSRPNRKKEFNKLSSDISTTLYDQGGVIRDNDKLFHKYGATGTGYNAFGYAWNEFMDAYTPFKEEVKRLKKKTKGVISPKLDVDYTIDDLRSIMDMTDLFLGRMEKLDDAAQKCKVRIWQNNKPHNIKPSHRLQKQFDIYNELIDAYDVAQEMNRKGPSNESKLVRAIRFRGGIESSMMLDKEGKPIDKQGKSSLYTGKSNKLAWRTSHEIDINEEDDATSREIKDIKIMRTTHDSGRTYDIKSTSAFLRGKAATAHNQNVAFDIETVGQRGDTNFGITEIGWCVGGKGYTALCRLTHDMATSLRNIIAEGERLKTNKDPERALSIWWHNLKRYDPTIRLGLERMMGDFKIGSTFGGDTTKMKPFLPSSTISFENLQHALDNITLLSSTKVPTAEEQLGRCQSSWQKNIDAGGQLVSFNGLAFDTGIMLRSAGKYRATFEKMFDDHHVDLRTILMSLGREYADEYVEGQGKRMAAYNLRAYADKILTKEEKELLNKMGEYHASEKDTQTLLMLLNRLYKDEKGIAQLEKMERLAKQDNTTMAIKNSKMSGNISVSTVNKGSMFVLKKGFLKHTREDYLLIPTKQNDGKIKYIAPEENAGKRFDTPSSYASDYKYNESLNFLLKKGAVVEHLGLLHISDGSYDLRVRDVTTNQIAVINFGTRAEASQFMSSSYGRQLVSDKEVTENQVAKIFKEVNSTGFGYKQAQRKFGSDNIVNIRLGGKEYSKPLGELIQNRTTRKLLEATEEGEALCRVYDIYDRIATGQYTTGYVSNNLGNPVSEGQKMSVFDTAMSRIQYHGTRKGGDLDVEDFLRKNLQTHEATGANSNYRYDVLHGTEFVNNHIELFGKNKEIAQRNARKVIDTIVNMREEDATSANMYNVIKTAIMDNVAYLPFDTAHYAKQVLDNVRSEKNDSVKFWKEIEESAAITLDNLDTSVEALSRIADDHVVKRMSGMSEAFRKKAILNIQKANPQIEDDKLQDIIDKSNSKHNVVTAMNSLIKEYAKIGVSISLLEYGNGTVELSIFNNADAGPFGNEKSTIRFQLPVQNAFGTAKINGMNVANSLRPVMENGRMLISDTFTEGFLAICDVLKSDQVVHSLKTGSVRQNSGAAANIVQLARGALNKVLNSVSSVSGFGFDKDIEDDNRAGVTIQQQMMRIHTTQWGDVNASLIAAYGGTDVNSNIYSRREALTNLNMYTILRSRAMQAKNEKDRKRLEEMSDMLLMSIFTDPGQADMVKKFYDDPNGGARALKLLPVDISDTQEDNAIKGRIRTLGAVHYTGLGEDTGGRALSQETGQYLVRNDVVQKKFAAGEYAGLVHRGASTNKIIEDWQKAYYEHEEDGKIVEGYGGAAVKGLNVDTDATNMHYYGVSSSESRVHNSWVAISRVVNKMLNTPGMDEARKNENLKEFMSFLTQGVKSEKQATEWTKQVVSSFPLLYDSRAGEKSDVLGMYIPAFIEGEVMAFTADLPHSTASFIPRQLKLSESDLTEGFKSFREALNSPLDQYTLDPMQFNKLTHGTNTIKIGDRVVKFDRNNVVRSIQFTEDGGARVIYDELTSAVIGSQKVTIMGGKGNFNIYEFFTSDNPIMKLAAWLGGESTGLNTVNEYYAEDKNGKWRISGKGEIVSRGIGNSAEDMENFLNSIIYTDGKLDSGKFFDFVNKLTQVSIQHGAYKKRNTTKNRAQYLMGRLEAFQTLTRDKYTKISDQQKFLNYVCTFLNLAAGSDGTQKPLVEMRNGKISYVQGSGRFTADIARQLDRIGYSAFKENYQYVRDIDSTAVYMFNESNYYDEHGKQLDSEIDFNQKGKFKVGPKTEAALYASAMMAGLTQEEAEYLNKSLIRRSSINEFAKIIQESIDNYSKEFFENGDSIKDIKSKLILSRQGESGGNVLKINDSDVIKMWGFNKKPDAQSITEWMRILWNKTSHVEGEKYSYGYVDLSNFGGGKGLMIGNRLFDKLAFPIYNPSFIQSGGEYLEKSNLVEFFTLISSMNEIFARDLVDEENAGQHAANFVNNIIKFGQRNGMIWKDANMSVQDASVWKKANMPIEKTLTNASKLGIFENAAFMNPKSIANLLKYESDELDKAKLKDNVIGLLQLSQGLDIDFDDAQVIGAKNKVKINDAISKLSAGKSIDLEHLTELQDVLTESIVKSITIKNIQTNENGELIFTVNGKNGDEFLTEAQMWKSNKFLDFMSRRFPEVALMSLQAVRLYAYDKVREANAMLGQGVYEIMNGDFDGDAVQFWRGLSNAKPGEFNKTKKLIDVWRGYQDYRGYMTTVLNSYKSQSEKKPSLGEIEEQKNPDDFDRTIVGIMSKFNKGPLGSLSIRATAVRNTLAKLYKPQDKNGKMSYANLSAFNIISGFGHFLEQESISAKNYDTIMDAAKGVGKTEKETLQDMLAVNEINRLFGQWASDNTGSPEREIQYFNEIVKKMKSIGLVSSKENYEGYFVGKIANTIVSTLGANLMRYIIDEKSGNNINLSNRLSSTNPQERAEVVGFWLEQKFGVRHNTLTINQMIAKKDVMSEIVSGLFGETGVKYMESHLAETAELLVAMGAGRVGMEAEGPVRFMDKNGLPNIGGGVRAFKGIKTDIVLDFILKASEQIRAANGDANLEHFINKDLGITMNTLMSAANLKEFQSGGAFSQWDEDKLMLLSKIAAVQRNEVLRVKRIIQNEIGSDVEFTDEFDKFLYEHPEEMANILRNNLEKYKGIDFKDVREGVIPNVRAVIGPDGKIRYERNVRVNPDTHIYETRDKNGNWIPIMGENGEYPQISGSKFASAMRYGAGIETDSFVNKLSDILLANQAISIQDAIASLGAQGNTLRDNLHSIEYGKVMHAYFDTLNRNYNNFEADEVKNFFVNLTPESDVATYAHPDATSYARIFGREHTEDGGIYNEAFVEGVKATAKRINEDLDTMFGKGKWFSATSEASIASKYLPNGKNGSILAATMDQMIGIIEGNNEFGGAYIADFKTKKHGLDSQVVLQNNYERMLVAAQWANIKDAAKDPKLQRAMAMEMFRNLPYNTKEEKANTDKYIDSFLKFVNNTAYDNLSSMIKGTIGMEIDPNRPNGRAIMLPNMGEGLSSILKMVERFMMKDYFGEKGRIGEGDLMDKILVPMKGRAGNIYGMDRGLYTNVLTKYLVNDKWFDSEGNETSIRDLRGDKLINRLFENNVDRIDQLTEEQKYAIDQIWETLDQGQFQDFLDALLQPDQRISNYATRYLSHAAGSEKGIFGTKGNTNLDNKFYSDQYTDLLKLRSKIQDELNVQSKKYTQAIVKQDRTSASAIGGSIRRKEEELDLISKMEEVNAGKFGQNGRPGMTDYQENMNREYQMKKSAYENDKKQSDESFRELSQNEYNRLYAESEYWERQTHSSVRRERAIAQNKLAKTRASMESIQNDFEDMTVSEDYESGDALAADIKQYDNSMTKVDRYKKTISKLRSADEKGNADLIAHLEGKIAAEEAIQSSIRSDERITDEDIQDLKTQHEINEVLGAGGKKEKNMSRAESGFKRLIGGSLSHYFSYGILYKNIDNLVQQITGLIKIINNLNAAATNLRIVTGKSLEETNSLIRGYQKLGKELGASTVVIAQSANEWLRQGYGVADTNKLIESTMKLSKLGMIESSKATSYLTSTLKGFKLSANESIEVVDKLTTLDMNYATSAGDIAEAMSRVASVANDANVDLDSTAAMLTTIMDITQMDSSMAGTSLRSMFSRYGSINASDYTKSLSGEELDGVNDIEKVLKTIGISTRGSNNSMRAFDDVLSDVAEKWINLTDIQKNAIATAMAGTRQRNAFISLVSNYGQVQEAKSLSENSAGQADTKYEAYLESIAYQSERLKNAWESVALAFENDGGIITTLKLFAWLIEHTIPVFTALIQLFSAFSLKNLGPGLDKIGAFISRPPSENVQRMIGTNKDGIDKPSVPTDEKKEISEEKFEEKPKGPERSPEEKAEVMAHKSDGDTTALHPMTKAEAQSELDALKSKRAELVATRDSAPSAEIDSQIASIDTTIAEQEHAIGSNPAFVQPATVGPALHSDEIPEPEIINPSSEDLENMGNPRILRGDEVIERNALYNGKGRGYNHSEWTGRNAAIYGVTSGLTGTVAGNQSAMSSLTSDIIKSNDKKHGELGNDKTTVYDIQSTTGDRLTSGILQGGLGAIGAIYGGPVGAMIGSAIGDTLATGIKAIVHADDMKREDEVKLANKTLAKINEISDVLEEVEPLSQKTSFSEYTSEDWKSYGEFVSTAKLNLYGSESQVEIHRNNDDLSGVYSISAFFEENLKKLGITASDGEAALNRLTDETITANEAINIMSAYSAAVSKLKYYAEYESKATEYKELNEKINNHAYDVVEEYIVQKSRGMSEDNEIIQELEREYELANDGENIQSGVLRYQSLVAQRDQIKKNVEQGALDVAFKSTGIINYSDLKIGQYSSESLIYQAARAWQDEGVENVFDAAGNLTDESKSDIISYMYGNERLSGSFASNKRFLGDYFSANSNDRRKELLQYYGESDFSQLVRLAKNSKSNISDADRNEILNLDDSQITIFAHKLGMTTDQLKNVADEFEFVSEANLSGTLEDVQTQFTEFGALFDEIIERGSLSVESLEKVIENTPYLLKGEDENGNKTISQENIVDNLIDIVFGGSAMQMYGGYAAFTAQTDEARWKLFWETYGGTDREKWKELFGNIDDKYLDKLTSEDTTFDDVEDLIYNNENAYKKWSETIVDLTAVVNKLTSLRSSIVKYEQKMIDNTVSELQSIKDTMNSINENRELEMKLIKAKDKLENATNEKQRVYRAGIGWTYEINQQNIQDAQKEVTEAENEKEGQNIQYQIDLLNQEKEILGNIEADESWENIKEVYEKFNWRMEQTGDMVLSLVSAFGDQSIETTIRTAVENAMKNQKDIREEDKNRDLTGLMTLTNAANAAWKEYYKAVDNEEPVEQLQEKFNQASAASETAYGEMVRIGNEYDLMGSDFQGIGLYLNDTTISGVDVKPGQKYSKETKLSDVWDELLKSESNADDYLVFKPTHLLPGSTMTRYYKIYSDGVLNHTYYEVSPATVEIPELGNGYYYAAKFNVNDGTYSCDNRNGSGKPILRDDIYSLPDLSLIQSPESGGQAWMKNGDQLFVMSPVALSEEDKESNKYMSLGYGYQSNALGTTNFSGGGTIINELGSEAIVTPSGTITSLPSNDDMDSTDLTQNLYNLGSISPNLIMTIRPNNINSVDSCHSVEDNSTQVGKFNALLRITNDFDFEKLINQAQQYINTTRNRR